MVLTALKNYVVPQSVGFCLAKNECIMEWDDRILDRFFANTNLLVSWDLLVRYVD